LKHQQEILNIFLKTNPMENIKASKQLNKAQTKWKFYFLALLKEGAYIEKQTMIINQKEVVAYSLKKDLHVTPEKPFKNIIYGQMNFKLAQQMIKKGFKVRENKIKAYCGGQTEQFFFSDYQKPMFNH
jgi:hypothetical protein